MHPDLTHCLFDRDELLLMRQRQRLVSDRERQPSSGRESAVAKPLEPRLSISPQQAHHVRF